MDTSTLSIDRPQPRRTALPSIRRVEAVVNPAAGGVGPEAAALLEALLDEFGLDHHVAVTEPEAIAQTVREAVAARPDLIIILAGDGTASLAADLCGPDGPLVAPLPGGTMNMLPKALYGERTWPEILHEVLARGTTRYVSGGEAGGHRFYCAAILGSPALWARAREAARAGKLARAWRHAVLAFRRAFLSHLRFQLDGAERSRAMALSLICPMVSRAVDTELALEAAALDLNAATDALRLGLSQMFGDWRRDANVTVRPCVRGRVWAGNAIPGVFDGEIRHIGRHAEIRFVPRAFRALVPDPDPAPAA